MFANSGDDEILTVPEVAKRAKVSARTVWRWEKEGVLPSVRVGGLVRFRASDVDALMTPRRGGEEAS